jgi:hypothetical protein
MPVREFSSGPLSVATAHLYRHSSLTSRFCTVQPPRPDLHRREIAGEAGHSTISMFTSGPSPGGSPLPFRPFLSR